MSIVPWRRLDAAERAQHKREFAAACADFGEDHFLRSYSLVGTRGDTDLMLRMVTQTIDPIHEFHVLLNQTGPMQWAQIAHSYLAMTKESVYSEEPQPLEPRPGSDAKYLIVYPMWKKREWYLLPADERMRIMRGHIETGKRYTGIEINTAYSYGLDDQEFVVSFNADEPGEFLDLVQELRSTARPWARCRSADALARRFEELLEAAQLHARPALRLAGRLLGAVDGLPARVGHVVGPALRQELLERVAVGVRG